MKKQLFSKQVCGLMIGVAGALAPFGSAQAADELADRYINGYLYDPYTNEVPPDTQSVLPPSGTRGAEGPVRSDTLAAADQAMGQGKFQRDQPIELYEGDPAAGSSGAKGPIKDDTAAFTGKPMTQEKFKTTPPVELYTGEPLPEAQGARGPIKDDSAVFAGKTMTQETFQRSQPRELYSGDE